MENKQEVTTQQAVSTPTPKRKILKGFLPNSQHDLLTLAENVSRKWEATPELTLLWVKPEELTKLVEDFRIFLEARMKAGSGRGSQTQTLNDFDTQINKAVEEVKLAILAKFSKQKGKAYYSEFGISKQGNSYKLPQDRNLRLSALSLFVEAVKNHNLKLVNFDDAFFDNILPAYEQAFRATQKTDSTVSIHVGNKNDLRKQIETILATLRGLIKLNYPNTFEGELRGWGFQREKY